MIETVHSPAGCWMKIVVAVGLLSASATAPHPARAQAPIVRQTPPAGEVNRPAADAGVTAAEGWKHRALILRGAYAGGELRFSARGQVTGTPKTVDWTLAGMDLEKVGRRPDGVLELSGTRVAIRYNPDAHEFQRHPQKDEPLRIEIAGVTDAASAEGALGAIFSTGMDPDFERAALPCWRHYFNPAAAWAPDELTGQKIAAGTTGPRFTEPELEKKLEPSFAGEAVHDRVKGTVVVRFAVDTTGVPRRIVIVEPLGYGLDARVVEMVERMRFRPAKQDGQAVAAEVTLRQVFE